jgi:putative transposase
MSNMKKSGFTDEQIIGFLSQAEAGLPNNAPCRYGSFGNAPFFNWRGKFGRMQGSDAQRL